MWSYSIGTHVATVILMLPTLLMPTVVAERAGLADAGYYYVASLIASVLLFVPQAAGRGLFAEAVAGSGPPARQLRRAVRLTAYGQVPLLVIVVALGKPLLALFGPEYVPAYPALVLLVLSNALASVGFLGSTVLLVSHRVRLLVVLSAAAYAVSVGGGYLLASRGLVWISAALLVGELILAAGYLRVIARALR
jgi:O-antigen/teichoic acid export membrane protein